MPTPPKDQPTANVPLSLVDGAIITTALSFVHAVLHRNQDAANESLKAMRVNIHNACGCEIISDIQTKIAGAVRGLPSECQVLDLALDGDKLVPLDVIERRRASRFN
jgi:hypothetical protein